MIFISDEKSSIILNIGTHTQKWRSYLFMVVVCGHSLDKCMTFYFNFNLSISILVLTYDWENKPQPKNIEISFSSVWFWKIQQFNFSSENLHKFFLCVQMRWEV